MRDSFILKICLQIVVVVILILGGIGYLIYLNRTTIANKLLDYTIQGMTGVVSTNKESNSNWLDALLNSGSDEVKNTIFDAVAKRGLKSNNTKSLTAMTDMLAKGTGNGEADFNQMAEALVNSLGIKENNYNTTRQVSHDVNARDAKGRTLLMNVCRVDVTPHVIKMLLQYGADVNAKDNNGRTALMYASAFNRNPDVIRILLEKGAKADIRDNKGKKASDYAKDEIIIDILAQ